MKQALGFALLILSVGVGAAWADEIEAPSRIESVTVFPVGAEVTRVARVTVDKGEHTIVFRDLPAGAVEGSIRVEGNATGRLEIGSVDTRRLFVPRADAQASASERRRLENEIERLRDQRATYDAEAQSAETQKELIGNLAQLPTRPAPVAGSAAEENWPAVLALITSASADAQRTLQAAQIRIRDTDRKIEDIEKQLREIAPERTERTEARVFVVAHAPLDADITVRYQVAHASWTPLYDVRLSTGSKTVAPSIDLTRRAAISQRSGEAWDNIELLLSTTRPTAGASAPELTTLIVDFEPETPPPPPLATTRRFSAERQMAPQAGGVVGEYEAQDMVAAAPAPEPVIVEERAAEVVQAPFHALFAVPGRTSIPDTGETKRVQLGSDTLEPALTIRTVPKVDAKAYLYAKLTVPKGAPLLPGDAALFRDGTFVGSGHLPLLSPDEEHEMGFGIDDLVRVRHAISEQKRGETGLISTSRTDSRHYLLSVKSMHERAISLAVFDQIPVSAHQDIKVELTGRTAPSRQDVDDKRGVLVWEGTLEPDQEQTVEFGYRVSWPSAKSVIYR
ncbi:mucoidy inhibitor MuiA family protein [Hyphomicrobium sp.]|uniref:mucoidy inhibitor MuiA family protein n=1 Tax=Hyphomicrobium sp. TaxID=82 RepID=UPI002C9512DD|nr:mucoidy inhibitor MuiA family protein [Hyphomicrobium sp.]HRN89343.1 mucoidy inhibitor MuiA family protein [Hyphomicrobium sp.]HRQ26408.1 mucoidy inhibitor MuiA family protein [Hyphomicrobium sp.]